MKSWQDWATAGGLAVGLLGLIVAYWQWRSSRNESEPYYRLRSDRIIGPSDPYSPFAAVPGAELALVYQGEAIDAANRAFLVIWNQGKRVLEGTSLLADDPLRVEVESPGFFLAEPRVIATTRAAINFSASRDSATRGTVLLWFNFLAHGDGALVELLFSGPSQAIELKGDFKAAKRPRRDGSLTLKLGRSRRDAVIERTVAMLRELRNSKDALWLVGGYGFLVYAMVVAIWWQFLFLFPLIVGVTLAGGIYLAALNKSGVLPPLSQRKRRLPRALRLYNAPALNAPRNLRALISWIWSQCHVA